MARVKSTITFFKEFMASPTDVGSVVPSSDLLADLATDMGRVRDASVVVEFGPGTGAITKTILRKLKKDADFFAMEINPEFVTLLRKQFPSLKVYNDSATNTPAYLAENGFDGCDAIVSGLPWTTLPPDVHDALLDAVWRSLRPGGRFVTYMYITSLVVPQSLRFKKILHSRFKNIRKSRVIWKNVPPAFVFYAEK